MPTPGTTFAGQYSDPAATATGWEETCAVLDAAELFWISTVRAHGRRHVTAVVAAWAEGAVWFSTGAMEQKCVDRRANPHVVLTTGCTSWDQGPDVMVDGDGVQVTDNSVLEGIAAVLATTWVGRGGSPLATAPCATPPTALGRRWCSLSRRSRSSPSQGRPVRRYRAPVPPGRAAPVRTLASPGSSTASAHPYPTTRPAPPLAEARRRRNP